MSSYSLTGQHRCRRTTSVQDGFALRLLRAIRDADYTRALGRIDVPTLILTRKEHRLISRETAQTLLKRIPASEDEMGTRTNRRPP